MTKYKNYKSHYSAIPPINANHSSGFTLVEFIVTITILAILITIATPYFIDFLQHSEAKDIDNKITTAIRTAKIESFTRHQFVIMCLANINNECDRNAINRLIVFSDKNDNHHYDANHDSLFLVQLLNLDYGHTYLRVGSKRHYVKFFGDTGLPRGHFGHIKYCPNSVANLNKYRISFNKLGGVKFKPDVDNSTDCPS